jgi:hypothetical protein
VKNLEKAPLFIDTPSCLFSIYGLKQDVWFRNTESNYNCRLFAMMTAGGNGKGAEIEAGDFYYLKLKSIS